MPINENTPEQAKAAIITVIKQAELMSANIAI